MDRSLVGEVASNRFSSECAKGSVTEYLVIESGVLRLRCLLGSGMRRRDGEAVTCNFSWAPLSNIGEEDEVTDDKEELQGCGLA